MKLKLFLVLVTCFQVSAAVHSQNKLLDVQLKNVSLEQVIWELEKKTDFTFMYWTSELREVKNLSLSMKQKSVSDILDFCLRKTDLRYEINGDAVVIYCVKDEKPQSKMMVIRGSVKDKKGEPLPGVTVVEKGTTIGTATRVNGEFTFTTTRKDSVTLIFSFVGMRTKVVLWKGEKELNIVLEDNAQEMDEVVVTGYQVLKKRSQAGSITTVKSDDLIFAGNQTLEQALQGMVPGMMVMNRNGLTGTRQRVRVRGTSTLLGNAEPVWVVDGIIQDDPLPFEANELTNLDADNMDMIRDFVGGAVSWLNPEDIDQVTILKDATSTAIYGVKAANGVIMISTKKGQAGRLSLTYNGNYSLTPKMSYNQLEVMNSKERVDVSREAFNSGIPLCQGNFDIGYMGLARAFSEGKISLEEFSSGVKKLETNNTDWFDILFRNAFSQNHAVSISGGSETASYRASIGYSETNNTAKGNDQVRYTGSSNVSMRLWEDRVTLGIALAGSVAETNAFLGSDPYSYATTINRAIPAYHEDGSLYFYPDDKQGFLYNAKNELSNSGNKNKVGTLNASLNLRWKIVGPLSFNSTFGYSYTNMTGESWYTEQTNYIANIRRYNYDEFEEGSPEYEASQLPLGGELNQMANSSTSWNWRNQLEFVKIFKEVHSLTVMFGQEVRSSTTNGSSSKIYGYLPDRGKIIVNLPDIVGKDVNPLLKNVPKITDTETNYLSFYGTLSYMYDDRYAVNASIRSDASNRFGQDKSARFLPVYALGLRWNIGSEHWVQGQDILTDMSLRVNFGYQGNVVENCSPYLIAMIQSSGEGYDLRLKDLPAPDLKWEKVSNVDIGFDWSLFSNKINGSFEWYYKKTRDMVTQLSVPFENGVRTRMVNGGSMTNSGWELSASFIPVRGKDWLLSCGVNISEVNNKVNSTIQPNGSWQELTTGNVSKDGYPVSSFWAFRNTGLNPVHGGPEFDLSGCTGEFLTDATMYMDHAGKMEPDFTAGINLSFRYKSFSLSTGLYLSVGNQAFLAPITNGMTQTIPSEYLNMSTEWLDRWREPGDEKRTSVPALPSMAHNAQPINIKGASSTTKFYPYEMYGYSTSRVVDAWYLRCNNINLSYTLPQNHLPNFLQSLSLNASVTNPFNFHSKDFKGRDPEVALGSQPLSHTFSFGLNMSF